MKKTVISIILCIFATGLHAQNNQGNALDVEAIKKVIQTAYVEGLQNEGDFTKVDKGFHPSFELLIPGEGGQLKKMTLPEWKEKIKKDFASGKMPRKAGDKVTINFLLVDVTGNAAVAKFQFFVGGKPTFVDYQFLYKFGDEWKIVSKIFTKI